MLKFHFTMYSLRRGGWCVYWSTISELSCEFVAGPFNDKPAAADHWADLEKARIEDNAEYSEFITELAKQGKN